jgi:ubiquinone/menaquinone biosynthesis C-methylase UbiE
MVATARGQVTSRAAEEYEALLVPALFQAWASRIADAGMLSPGDHVLDIACGTGVLERNKPALNSGRAPSPNGHL